MINYNAQTAMKLQAGATGPEKCLKCYKIDCSYCISPVASCWMVRNHNSNLYKHDNIKKSWSHLARSPVMSLRRPHRKLVAKHTVSLRRADFELVVTEKFQPMYGEPKLVSWVTKMCLVEVSTRYCSCHWALGTFGRCSWAWKRPKML